MRLNSVLSSLQLLCLHVANGISALFTSGLFSADEAMGYVRLLADLATKAPTVCLSVSQFVCLSVCLYFWSCTR